MGARSMSMLKIISSIIMGACLGAMPLSAAPSKQPLLKNKAELKRAIEQVCASVDPHMQIGIEFSSLEHGPLYRKNYKHRVIPASALKLYPATAMLYTFGPDYQFVTRLVTDGVVKKHSIRGDLYIVGAGDPSLKSADIRALFAQLKLAGIAKIKGNIYIDMTIFDEVFRGPGWMWDDPSRYWNCLVTGLVIDHNCTKDSVGKPVAWTDPVAQVKRIVRTILEQEDICYSGDIFFQKAPVDAELLSEHTSEPLQVLSTLMLKESDNLYADCFFKRMGAEKSGKPGTWQEGALAVDKFGSGTIVDGSGISRYNLVTPNELVNLLQWHIQQPYFTQFRDMLSRSGCDRVLKQRLHGQTVWAKTGTQRGNSSLAGYMLTADKELVAFAIIINNFVGPTSKYLRLQDQICACVGRFSRQMDV